MCAVILFIMYKLSYDIIQKNKLTNYFANKKHACYAPFISLNFDSSGCVTACCVNRTHVLGKYPENTIFEIWNGEKIKELRTALDNYDFSKGCQLCYNRISEGAIRNSLLKNNFDTDYAQQQNILPSMIELEISTICNYECIMCGGKWSSSIRKNREKLPPLYTPYDDKFITDLKPYVKSLKFIKLLGGEPFAAPIYYKLLDMLYEVNRNVEINVTTNCSIYNEKVENVLKRGQRISLCISIDSVNEKTYNFIRKNGNLTKVLENIKRIQNIERETGRGLIASIAFCPMIQNWKEIPDIIRFCKNNSLLGLDFNHVTGPLGGRIKGIHDTHIEKRNSIYNGPSLQNIKNTVDLEQKLPEVSLFTLPIEEQREIAAFLSDVIKNESDVYKAPVQGLINSLLCT